MSDSYLSVKAGGARQSAAVPPVDFRAAKRFRAWVLLALLPALLSFVACARGSREWNGWVALEPSIELRSEPGGGPGGESALALLYALVPGAEYGIERQMPIAGLQGRPSLRLMARATRVLYVAVVLVDDQGLEHECARYLQPGEWRTLDFDTFEPPVADWSRITAIRFVDRTGLLIGQGTVSLKLVGLPQ